MAAKKKAKKMGGSAKAWGIGAGVTAAAIAAAAGAYLLTDKKTKTKAKAWIGEAKKEVVKHVKAAKKLGQNEYGKIVEQVVKHYGSMENLTAADVMMAAKELKGHWKNIQAEAEKMKKTLKKPAAKKVAHTTKATPAAKKKRG